MMEDVHTFVDTHMVAVAHEHMLEEEVHIVDHMVRRTAVDTAVLAYHMVFDTAVVLAAAAVVVVVVLALAFFVVVAAAVVAVAVVAVVCACVSKM